MRENSKVNESIDIIKRINDNEKEELLYKIITILEILPKNGYQRTLDYLMELYFS